MHEDISLEAVAFNLKLLGKTPTNVLVSAGKPSDKEAMLPGLRRLKEANVQLYATPGTSRFLVKNGIANILLHKINDAQLPNIRSFLDTNRFDMVVNVLTGNNDYDEASDCNLIRSLSIEAGIPIYTDAEVAMIAIREMLRKHQAGQYRYKLSDPTEPWNLKRDFLRRVAAKGGFACHHAHFDKAYLISTENLKLGQVDMQAKWKLYKYLKENYTPEDLLERMERAVRKMIAQGVTYCRTFVDADTTVGQMPIDAALLLKERFRDQIRLEIAVQPLQGVLEPDSQGEFVRACEKADVIGGLPSKDRPQPEKHLDFIFSLARELNKPVDVHVDQENNPDEVETELLALKTMEFGLHGRVRAVHGISLAAHDERYQRRVIAMCREAAVAFIVCPSAALSMRQLSDRMAPIHNSIAPVTTLLHHGVRVVMGVDNIYDLFMPLVDGDMWVECRLLMEATRYYDIDVVSSMATDKSGFAVPPGAPMA